MYSEWHYWEVFKSYWNNVLRKFVTTSRIAESFHKIINEEVHKTIKLSFLHWINILGHKIRVKPESKATFSFSTTFALPLTLNRPSWLIPKVLSDNERNESLVANTQSLEVHFWGVYNAMIETEWIHKIEQASNAGVSRYERSYNWTL